MARKKKTASETTSKQSIGYSGKVRLVLKAGRTTILTKTYSNHGAERLFKFLCFCLAGQYRAADTLRPTKIMLFYSSGDPEVYALTDSTSSSGFISNNTVPTPSKEAATDVWKTTFHFLIPKIYITGQYFNQIALYGADTLVPTEFSAIFNLTKKEGSAVNFDTIDTSQWADNFNLVVEWEMILNNK